MKESTWLKQYEKEAKAKRGKSNDNKKVILIIIPIMLLLFLGLAMVNGGAASSQGQNGMVFLVVIFAAIIIFAIIMMSIGKKKDVTKSTRENVLALLGSDSEVDSFDSQMSQAPIKEVSISTETTVFLTESYVGMKFVSMGDLNYRFIHREEIAFYDYSKTASTTANPINAAFFFDIKNGQKKVILNGQVDSGSKMVELEELLKTANPNVTKG